MQTAAFAAKSAPGWSRTNDLRIRRWATAGSLGDLLRFYVRRREVGEARCDELGTRAEHERPVQHRSVDCRKTGHPLSQEVEGLVGGFPRGGSSPLRRMERRPRNCGALVVSWPRWCDPPNEPA